MSMQKNILAVAASVLIGVSGLAWAANGAPDFASIIERIPEPPNSVVQAGQDAQNKARIEAQIKQLHAKMAAIHQAVQFGSGTSATAKNTLASEGVHDRASAQALKKKLSHMSRQEKMAWAMKRQRRMQGQMAAQVGAQHQTSPATRKAFEQLEKIHDELRGPYHDDTGYGPAIVDTLNAELKKADAQLDQALKSLKARYPTHSAADLGYKGSFSGSLADEHIVAYIHGHHLCHKYLDDDIKQAQAWPGIYDNWLAARAKAWRATRSKLEDIAGREQAALDGVAPGAGAAIDRTHRQATVFATLGAIGSLIETSQSYKDNGHYHDMDDASIYNPDGADHDSKVVAGITHAKKYYKGRLNACLAGNPG